MRDILQNLEEVFVKKKVVIASDHAGFQFKQDLVNHFKNELQIEDLGPFSEERTDYPDWADKVVQAYRKDPQNTVGILICGSGQGMAMRANKYPDIRAALCWTEEVAQLSRGHNDANILCLGSRLVPLSTAQKIVEVFLSTSFEGDRHAARVKKISSSLG